MQRATTARNEIGPLLDQLIFELEVSGRATQRAYFCRVRKGLSGANDDLDLAESIKEISSCTALGFQFTDTADVLVSRILDKVGELIREMEGVDVPLH